MSVLVLAGVEVVSDDKVDENVMVEAKLVVDGGRGGRGWRGAGLVPPSSSSRPEKGNH